MARNVHEDGGAAAVEAGLLMVAVLVVLLPVAFALGALVRASFTHACTAAGGCGASGPGAPAVHGASSGSADTGQATQQVQQVVTEELVADNPDGGTPVVGCPGLTQPWPPVGTEITCTATYPTGETTQVRVRFTDAEGHVALVS